MPKTSLSCQYNIAASLAANSFTVLKHLQKHLKVLFHATLKHSFSTRREFLIEILYKI